MRISDWSSDVCSSDLCRFGSQGLDGLCVVLGGQPVGCPLFNSLPDLAIVKCTDAMAHILKEVPLIAAALTEPRICDGMHPRRHSALLGGRGQYDITVCWRPVRVFRPGDNEIGILLKNGKDFRQHSREMDFPIVCQRD